MHPVIPGIGRGVSQGTLAFDGDIADEVFDRHQPGQLRKLRARSKFISRDMYRYELMEDSGSGFGLLLDLEYKRSDELSPFPPVALYAARPAQNLAAFGPLAGPTWRSKDGAESAQTTATFEWIPYIEAVRARMLRPAERGESEPLLDVCVYLHPRSNAIHCLALSNGGGVHEGRLAVLGDGRLSPAAGEHGCPSPRSFVVRCSGTRSRVELDQRVRQDLHR